MESMHLLRGRMEELDISPISGFDLEGGETSREDGNERSVGDFRLAREHGSDVGRREDGGRKHRILPGV